MSQRLSTAGVTLSYAAGAKDTIPTSGFVVVNEVKSTPSTNPEPQGIDVTPLQELFNVLYIAGLKDLGGVLAFPANCTDDVITEWNTTHMAAYETAESGGQVMWYCLNHPKLSQSVFFQGIPEPLNGFSELSVNAPLETTYYIAPQSSMEFAAAPTFASA